MGLLDEAKDKVEGLVDGDKVDSVMEKVEETINKLTGDKFADKVDSVTDAVREKL